MTDLALPGVRVRRRRLPRPPKFTRRQKMMLAMDLLCGTYGSLGFFSGEMGGITMLAAAVAGIHGTTLDALRPPLGGHLSTLASITLYMLSAVLFVTGLAVPS